MNLLEHYIKEIYSVDDVTSTFEKYIGRKAHDDILRVHMKVHCYGVDEDIRELFFKSQFEKAKEDGYYMA